MKKYLILLMLSAFSAMTWAVDKAVPQFDITWNELGTDENCSMPLGNGDIAVNAWTEQNGDLVMLIAKTDAWSENALLLKLGRVRLSLSPNPFVGAGDFKQTLTIGNATMTLKAGKNEVKEAGRRREGGGALRGSNLLEVNVLLTPSKMKQ